ncbi:MAG: hypothetical protein Q9220_001127 [cf. Caloplaca sp. 1 TL-2023]
MSIHSISAEIALPLLRLRQVPLGARLINLSSIACIVWFVAYIVQHIFQLRKKSSTEILTSVPISLLPKPIDTIEPLKGFDYRKVAPNPYRPFLNKGHVKMGISRMPRREWIKIDSEYLNRINRRKCLLKNYPEFCVGSNEAARPAIRELYDEVMNNHLPKRFPTMFFLKRGILTNRITRCKYFTKADELDDTYMLNALAENVEEDFYFMCPDSDGEYRLQAYSSCFPQGLHSAAKMGLSVRQIHQPIPEYESRLGNGVDKHFRRMEPGTFVGRLNWSIQTDGDELFKPLAKNTGNPDAAGTPAHNAVQQDRIDLNQTYLRCEHHTLTCLRKSRVVMFCVRSYLTPIQQIKEEGHGSALADACDSMPEKFGVYKRRPVWGDQLCRWLRDAGRPIDVAQ